MFLLTAIHGCFEDAHVSRLNDVEAGAGLTFAKNNFTGLEAAQHGALRKEGQFVVAEPTEDGDARQGRADAVPGIGHAGIVLVRSR